MGGGILNENAFTLIELLAIIVILAIIAVITVPIILNIIENSRKGAATDSAYGYKDAVNKAYVQELAKPNQEGLKLNGTYEVQSDGTLVPADGYSFGITNYNTLPVSVSGDKPTSGTLTYSNNVLTDGTLIIGDYTVTYSDGSFTAVKTSSISNKMVEESTQGEEETQQAEVPTIDSCPGCDFIFADNTTYGIAGSDSDYNSYMPTAEEGLTNDYRTIQREVEIWIADDGTEYYDYDDCYYENDDSECEEGWTSEQRPYFLGLIESTDGSGKIERAFVCGIENDTPFCLEGYDTSKWADDANVGVLNTILPACNASSSALDVYCGGQSVGVDVSGTYGFIRMYDVGGYCMVWSSGINNGIIDCGG